MPAPTTTQDLVSPPLDTLQLSAILRGVVGLSWCTPGVGTIHGMCHFPGKEGSSLDGSEVDLYSVLDPAGVAACHRQGDRNTAVPTGLEHEAVSFGETFLADGK